MNGDRHSSTRIKWLFFSQIVKFLRWIVTFQLRERLIRRQIARLIGSSGLFETGYYCQQNPEVQAEGHDPLGHYLDIGAARGRNPHPLFDSQYYLQNNPEVAASGMNPLAHYLSIDASRDRNPHPLFDSEYYLKNAPEAVSSGMTPLAHYVMTGAARGRNPHPLFDSEYYLKNAPEAVSSGMTPLAHYVTIGASRDRNPHPLFDSEYYLKNAPEAVSSGMTPLEHYLSIGAARDRNPHPLFDSEYYRKNAPEATVSGMSPLEHYLSIGAVRGRNPHPLFDSEYYWKNHPEIAGSEINPLLHCLRDGIHNTPYSSLATDKPSSVISELIDVLTETELTLPLAEEARGISFPAHAHPRVSIIIPVYNQLHYTIRCLKGLTRQKTDLSFEVIVVDDRSTDLSAEILPSIEGIKYLRNPENYGFLRSCNLASEKARGDFIILLNNDTIPFPDWLTELIAPFFHQETIGLVGSRLIYPNGALQEAGGLIWKDGSGANFGREKDPSACEYNFVRETDYCSGASIALPASLWRKLKGFDPLFLPAYYEDTDLAFRVRKAGYQVIYTPFSKIVHFEGITSGTDVNKGVKRYQVINQPKFLERWRDTLRDYADPPRDVEKIDRDHRVRYKLLMIDVTTPTPDRDSGSGDIFNFLKVVRQQEWGVTFIADNFFHDEDSPYIRNLQRMGVECIYHPHWNSIEKYIKLHGNRFDIIVLCRIEVAAKYIDIARQYAPNAKLIFNTIDLHFLRQSREANILGKPELIEEAAKTFRDEILAIGRCDRTIVISKTEAEVVKKLVPFASVSVIPIVREIPKLEKRDFEHRRDIGFIGGFNFSPNEDAVHFFVSSIFPLILQELPDCRFIIAGSNVTESVAELASEKIIVKGYVADLSEFFGNIRVSVAPLRFGAGMKGKVVSSLSYGVPVVATGIAVEGMGLTPGKEALVSDKPEEFARSIIDLYNSPEKWENMSIEAAEFARKNFSLETVGREIQATLNAVLSIPDA